MIVATPNRADAAHTPLPVTPQTVRVTAAEVSVSCYGVAAWDRLDWRENAADILHDTVEEVAGSHAAGRITNTVVRGHGAVALLHASRDAALLVGGRGHGGFAGLLLGSVSQHVVTHASCPVVVVHAPAAAVHEANG